MVADYWPLPPPPKRKAGDDPARPVVGAPGAPQDYPGLSKREELAKAALPAVIRSFGACDPEGSAAAAVRHADALIAALNAAQQPEAQAAANKEKQATQKRLEMIKHTEGPWRVLPEEVHKDYIRVRGTALGRRYKIANVLTVSYAGAPDTEAEETRANARLIATAPDLLYAIIVIEAALDGSVWSDTKRELRALIAEATGETP